MLKEFLNSKLATVLLSGALVLVMIITAKILVQKRMVDREVAKLQNQMDRISSENQELGSLVQYLNTPEYKEREAREKLNLAKEGEHIVVLPQGDTSGATQEQVEQKQSNYKLWLSYFFDHAN